MSNPRQGICRQIPHVVSVESDGFFTSKEDLENLVISSSSGNVVYLKDIAQIVDGPDEQEHYVNIRFGCQEKDSSKGPFEAVTLAVSKRKGANAAWLCDEVIAKVNAAKGALIPADVKMEVTRNYGQTATEKSNELLFHMGIAVIGVTLLIALVLGWKEAGIVAIAIPVTLALTLASFYWLGFTLNRITLFALIFSIGILVDDPIVNVENIVRHLRLAQNRGRKFLDIVIGAVSEVQAHVEAAVLPERETRDVRCGLDRHIRRQLDRTVPLQRKAAIGRIEQRKHQARSPHHRAAAPAEQNDMLRVLVEFIIFQAVLSGQEAAIRVVRLISQAVALFALRLGVRQDATVNWSATS